MAVDYAPDQAKQAARERFRGCGRRADAAAMAADLEAAGLPVDRAGALAAG
jgi:hypothetical protein